MSEDEMYNLWKAFDELGYDYEQVKSLALSLLLRGYPDKDYETLYMFLVDVQQSYGKGNEIIN